uniref:Uncharacterized protein n=1 Tax=Anguilla anguilla TaxID=7936 RepID=A0A0E9S2X5_ANGAN
MTFNAFSLIVIGIFCLY